MESTDQKVQDVIMDSKEGEIGPMIPPDFDKKASHGLKTDDIDQSELK